eukprot:6175722-Pleurochrysis_carterae.AAC.1
MVPPVRCIVEPEQLAASPSPYHWGRGAVQSEKHEICAPFFGETVEKFLKVEQDFRADMSSKGDEYTGLAEAL